MSTEPNYLKLEQVLHAVGSGRCGLQKATKSVPWLSASNWLTHMCIFLQA